MPLPAVVEVAETDKAWLAGLIDGEGSIGLYRNGGQGLVTALQINMTHRPTIDAAWRVLRELGVRGCTYTYTEKLSHHKDAHLLTVRRAWDLRIVAQAVLPYAVTKRPQWEAMLEYVERRLEGVEVDQQGRVHRGGSGQWWKPFEDRDYELAERVREVNRRARS